jgi:hypothetical protein
MTTTTDKQETGGWRGVRVLITANSHDHYNQVATIIGQRHSESGEKLLCGQLNSGLETVLREGQFKLTSIQN